MDDHKLKRYCGVGVQLERSTIFGLQVSPVTTAMDTPAKKADIRMGDIITHVHAYGNQWKPLQTHQDFHQLIGGMERSKVTMRVLRMPSDDSYRYPLLYTDDELVAMRNRGELQEEQITITRAEIVNRITREQLQRLDLRSIPYRSVDEAERCQALAENNTPSHGLPEGIKTTSLAVAAVQRV